MTDKGDTKSGGALRALGLRSKTAPMPPAITDEELHDEAVIQAISGTRQMRKELAEWKHKAEQTIADFSAFRHDTAQELLTQKHEYESKAAMLRAKIEAQDGMLKELGHKLEHYERLAFELSTKCDDVEKFYLQELRTIRDAANHMVLGMVSNINNATVGLNEAAKHSGEGLVKQVENSANNMASFIDDLRNKRDAGEYRPKPRPKEQPAQPALSIEDEERLSKLSQHLSPMLLDQEDVEKNS